MAMLACYMDESSSPNEKEPAACVAGYLASGKQWANFGKNWNAILDSAHVEIFHANELETELGRRGTVYESWSAERRKQFQASLIDVIATYTLRDFGVGIYYSAYEKVMTRERQERWGNIYALCARFCMIHATAWAYEAKFPRAPNFFYERGGGYSKEVKQTYDIICAQPESGAFFQCSELFFKPKSRLFPQLQAADYLAFNMSKRISHVADFSPPSDAKTEIVNGKTIRRTRAPLALLYSDDYPPNLYTLPAEQLEAILTAGEN